MEERVSKEGTMVQRILIGIGALLAGVLITWFVANAGVGMKAPDITNETWLNSAPLHLSGLKGKVVMVEFWTFGCYNCRNVELYVKQWHQKYADKGLVIIGVHSPEFSYEHDFAKVKEYIRDHDIRFPIPIDNDFSTWNRYANRYWPAMYLIDKQGVIRYVRIGEGGYQETEQLIRNLLVEPS
jgi:thiol-disulfide isomerase/thioredoxin